MNTPDILFQYLKNIIYHTEEAELDIDQLPSEFYKLGQGMQLLGKWMLEAKRYSMSMAQGDLSYESRDKENVFAAPMKELQGTLRHLTWQTQQIAKGDYNQTVDFMGDFSEAFNTMTRQLRERSDALMEEKHRIEEKNKELENAVDLVRAFADFTQNMIVIYEPVEKKELLLNEAVQRVLKEQPVLGNALMEKLKSRTSEEIEKKRIWEFEVVNGSKDGDISYYRVESYPIRWQQDHAVAHIVVDDTERRRKENAMYRLAYVDALTGVYNQRYAREHMNDWIRQGIPFTISFIDVDYLKYCNDTWGHKTGDAYLLAVSRELEKVGGIHCRTGGDEFMVLWKNGSAKEQDQKLEQARAVIQKEGEGKAYPQSFSFASCEVPAYPEKSLDEYLILADAMMYQYKIKNRKPLSDLIYKDDRKPD